MFRLNLSSLKKLSIPKYVWVIFFVALLVRLWGIRYGLPLQLNMDEPSVVSATFSLSNNNFHPGRFDWPSLYFYINAIVYFGYTLLRGFLEIFINLPDFWHDTPMYFLISRLITVFFGAATVISIFILTRSIFNTKTAYIAAIILAVLPVHVYESHFAKLDVAQAFVISIAVYWIYQIYKTGSRKSYLFAGILIGIATSIKYSAFLLALPVLIAYLMRVFDEFNIPWTKRFVIAKSDFLYLIYAGILSILFFYLGTPYAAIDYKTFFSTEFGIGAMWQFQNVGKVTWAEYPFSVIETFIQMYQGDLGFWLWVVFTSLLILFLFFNKRSKEYLFLLLPTIILSLYISKLERSPSHYFLMLIPFYLPAIAAFISEIADYIIRFTFKNRLFNKEKFVLPMLLVIFIFPSLLISIEYSFKLSRADTRNLAYQWIEANLEDDDYLYVYGDGINTMSFKESNTSRIRRIERQTVEDTSPPFYIMLSSDEFSLEDITGDNSSRDIEAIPGNNIPILTNSELVFYTDNDWRFGWPIYILKINEVIPRDD